MSSKSESSIWEAFGPGILLAGAAVGTSHIVQSTRAGADFSLGFLFILVLIALIKYPATRFGKDYAQVTNQSLIQNYSNYGWPVMLLYSCVIFITFAFVTPALGLVSASIINSILPMQINGRYLTVGIILFSAVLLWFGKYKALEKLNKFIVPAFTLLIFLTTAIIGFQADWSLMDWSLPAFNSANMVYMIAIAGWLLAPMEVSVFLSLWTVEKNKDPHYIQAKQSNFDFNLGYGMSLILALCFLLMGAALLHSQSSVLPTQGGAFIAEFIKLFSQTLGAWSYPVIAFIALSVMYSTLLTVMDGYARNVQTLIELSPVSGASHPYKIGIMTVAVASILVILAFMKSFAVFIDFVGILVFVLGPVFAILNHRAVFGRDIALKDQPSKLLRFGSWCGIVVMSAVALGYLYTRFF